MRTDFFKHLQSLPRVGQWTINISVTDTAEMLVSVLLKGGADTKAIPPMIFSGTAEDLDEGFFPALAEPAAQTATFFINAAEHAEGLEKARAELKRKAETKSAASASVPKKDEATESKKAYEEVMKKVTELNSNCKYEQALEILPANSDFPDKKEELEKMRRELEWKKGQLSLL